MVMQDAGPAVGPVPQRPARTEDQVVGALAGHVQSGLVVTLAGETRYIRPLKITAERAFKERVAEKIGAAALAADSLPDMSSVAGLQAILGSNVEDVLELVAEFDHLGGGTLSREWLEENVYGTEIRDALGVLLDSVYPPIPGAATKPSRILLALILAGEAARSASATSTNASSPGTRGSTGRKTSKPR